ncbi:whisker protein [Klebsiella phage vB_KpM-Mild]|uniref:Ig-like domain-containing protein n=1 Tax=Klebsiella phage K14-2 TaxID=3156075 RepID=A0AB39C8T0_9VIRU|nr:fibritin [Klebsiella phage AYL]WMX18034.1 whisker protein [Klebsiella phage KpF2]CAD5241702.1 whisker protein [Klebsiella phage vB_KpM-SoFaint]CAD5242867.1 whisker protein [Klebsiella phage vB_KpM-KalD]CAD5242872.1 whisker protein [Klebsiella phage vB_KpM-Mild]HCU2117216.1 phage neck protein fibritin [Klebsiella pneumoniae]
MIIDKLNPLPKIPFVDGVPDDATTQTKIIWIKNGETLDGSPDKVSNTGSLNRTGVNIQQNAVQLEQNTITHNDKINEVIDQVNLITENIDAIGDESVIKKVNQLDQDVRALTLSNTQTQNKVAQLTLSVNAQNDEIGEYDPEKDPKHRTIRNDIIYIKKEVGSYPGFNVDGDVDPSSTGTGLKYRVLSNQRAISMQETRITKLEDDWALSEVGQLTEEVKELRAEMGDSGLATTRSIYARIKILEDGSIVMQNELDAINSYIGRTSGSTSSINDRVNSLENSVSSLATQINDPVTGITAQIATINGQIGTASAQGSIRYDIAETKRRLMDMEMILGESGDDGLQGQVAILTGDVGEDSDPTSIKGRLSVVEGELRTNTSALWELQGVVGNSSSGLVATSQQINKEIYGDGVSSDPVTRAGLKTTTRNLFTQVGDNAEGNETGIYALIADLNKRVEDLEALNIAQALADRVTIEDLNAKLALYIKEADADLRYESKNPPLSFGTNLTGDTEYTTGDPLSLSVTMTGGVSPLSYQWTKNGVNVGTNANTFTIDSLQPSDSGTYKVTVTDASHKVIVSDELAITVA